MSGANDPYDPKEVAALSAEHLDAAVQKAREAFAGAADLEALASVKPGHLGDRSPVLLARREIGALPPKAKAEAGKRVNEAQSAIKTAFDERHAVLQVERDERVLREESVDVTLPWDRFPRGARHPITTLAERIGDVFVAMGYEIAEVNGSTGTAAYELTDPNRVRLSLDDRDVEMQPVPDEFLVAPGSPRDPNKGAPSTVFRYDLVWEFVSAIVEGRDAVPGFDAGARAQAVADAVLLSFAERRWVDVDARLESLRHFLLTVAHVVYRRFFRPSPGAESFARVLTFSAEPEVLSQLRERVYAELRERVLATDAAAPSTAAQGSVIFAAVTTPTDLAWRKPSQ